MKSALRKEFEQWYAENAFDYVSNPVGSRDCGLQWAAWQAAVEREPLTDEEIDHMAIGVSYAKGHSWTHRDLARRIETHHGVKAPPNNERSPCCGGLIKTGYKIGDRIRLTTLTWGERVVGRKGKEVNIQPVKSVYEGVVKFAGPEGASRDSVEVVRCSGGDKELKLNMGFSFYPKDNGPEQIVELIK